MDLFPPTVILRHRRENLKKCSLRGLEKRPDFHFFSYPLRHPLPDLSAYLLLSFEGPPLTLSDAGCGLVIIDATWKLAEKMQKVLPTFENRRRCLPFELVTAYPRYQTDCPHPDAGLASIEALYAAYFVLGRPSKSLLKNYYWKEAFLDKNQAALEKLSSSELG